MKIALLYAAWDGEGWSTPIGFRNELESRGHEIQHYNLYHDDGRINPRDRIRHYSADCLNKLMRDYSMQGYRPDVVYVMDYGQFDTPAQDKKFFPDTTWIMEAGDEPQTFNMNVNKARKFHGVLTPDKMCADAYGKMGIQAKWHTHHADHRLFYPRPEITEEFDCITTCGPRGAGLTEKIAEALGDRFSNHRYYYGEKHAERLNMGKMVFQCSQYKEVTRRIFEGMACGKMAITDRLDESTGLADLFTDGVDIVYYSNAEEAIEKIRYYAEHDDERLRIAQAGYQKVMQNHTVASRVDQFEEFAIELTQPTIA